MCKSMQKANARSPSSSPFLQRFLTIGEQITSVFIGNRFSQMGLGMGEMVQMCFIVLVQIFDAAAWGLRGWGRSS